MPWGVAMWGQTPRFGSGLLYEAFTACPDFPQGAGENTNDSAESTRHIACYIKAPRRNNAMSPKLASVGFSTAAEAAWFDQEVTSEQAGFLERPSSQRRMLIVFAAAFLVIGSVLGVARAAVRSNTGRSSAAAAPVAPAPMALAAKKPAPAPLAAPRVAIASRKAAPARAVVAKATKKPVHKAPAKKKSKRPARHR
jgi:hypothetical protein